ncbi:MAG: Flp pilus assembly protein CpaB [Bdellovibrionales bacterium]|nr:Flp pilus assembly protein CpaB [Bdellovibrionales bacterium]
MNSRFGSMGPRRQAAMRERLLYIGGGAITFALAAIVALIIYSYNEVEAHQTVAVPDQPVEQVAFGTVVLLAPKAPVPHGTKLSQVALREIHWPRNEVPEGAVRRADDVRDMYSKVDLPANQPILRANLSSTPLLGGVADLIPPGHRATTIEVDATAGVEGWATPGAHVDILVTYHDRDDGQKKTQIAVEDAVVVSFNGQTRNDTNGMRGEQQARMGRSTATVTLATPVEDSLKIHTARAMGRISLLLRNTSDLKSVGNVTVSASDLRSSQRQDKGGAQTIGHVRYEGQDGVSRELELRSDKKWYLTQEE